MRTLFGTYTQKWLLGTVLVVMSMPALLAQAYDLRVEVNGRRVPLGWRHQPYQDRGVWMLPARPILDAARISHYWDARRQELEVWARFERFVVTVGSYTVVKYGGRRETISRPIALRNGEPYAPVDFLEMCLDTRATYDRRNEILSFGRSSWTPPRDEWRWRDDGWWDGRWRRGDDPYPRGRPRLYRPLTLECPAVSYTRVVRLEGDWSGTAVRVRLIRLDGGAAINRTASTRDGRWSMELHLSRGTYRVIAEGLEQSFVRETRERMLEVR